MPSSSAGTAVLFIALPSTLAGWYTHDGAVAAFATTLLPIAGVFQLFDGLQTVSVGILRGIGDTRTPMIVNLLGFGLVGLGSSLWLAFRTPLGAVGLWWGLVIGLAAVAATLVYRVHRATRVTVSRTVLAA
jgi:MATE family multidrug resistance protein